MEISVIVGDPDQEFLKRLSQYVRNHATWRKRMDLRMATTLSHLQEQISHSLPHVVIVVPEWVEAVQKLDLPCTLFRWSDGKEYEDDLDLQTSDGVRNLKKFDLVSNWLNEISSIGSNGTRKGTSSGSSLRQDKAKVTVVSSASGGTGKTTLCLHLLRAWMQEQYRVLYVNLESVPSPTLFGNESNPQVDRMVYLLQHRPEEYEQNWSKWITKHEIFGFDFIMPVQHLQDRKLFCESHIKRCMQMFRSSGQFDRIVLDVDSGINEAVVNAFIEADEIIWLEATDRIGQDKSERMKQGLEEWLGSEANMIRSKMRTVQNRVLTNTGALSGLPYVSEWKQRNSWTDIWRHEPYAAAVQKMCRSWEVHVS